MRGGVNIEQLLERLKKLEKAMDNIQKGSIGLEIDMFSSKADYELVTDKIMPLVRSEIESLEEKIKTQLLKNFKEGKM